MNRPAKIASAERPNASGARFRLRRWYRGRPVIGGLLTVLAGLEMALSGQLDLGSIRIQVGIEGMQAMILPLALATLGVLIIVMPVHRIFYGVLSLAFSIYAIVGVNLGGFFIGTLLGIVGGIMCVSWAPRRILVADAETATSAAGLAPVPTGEPVVPGALAVAPGAAAKGVAIVAVLLLVFASAAGLSASPSFAETPEPTPSATADPVPSASASPDPVPSDPGPAPVTIQPAPTPPAPALPKPSAPRATLNAAAASAPPIDPGAPLAAIPSARLRSSAVALEGALFVGTVRVALAGGSTATVLKITADRVSIERFTFDSTDPTARILLTTAARLTLDGPVTIYATSLSGALADGSAISVDVSSPPPPGVALPSLTDATIALVSVTSATATLVGAVETVR